jgi:hypothetical protein
VIERGYEGYVAKDERSVHECGATRRWLKVKQKDWTVKEDGWRRRIIGGPVEHSGGTLDTSRLNTR